MTDKAAVVERFASAIGGGDMTAAMALLAPDIVIYHSSRMPYAGIYHGHDGFLRMLGIIDAFWQTFGSAVPPLVAEIDDAVVVAGRVTGRPRHLATDLTIPVMERYSVDGGLITRIDPCYADLDLTPEQLGLHRPTGA